ncbi:MAG: DinB family protein [Ignavibacteria bacterium]
MTYTTVDEFLGDWAFESDATLKVIGNITDPAMKQKVTPTGRSLGFLGWHLAETVGEMMGKTGLKVFTPDFTTGHWKEESAADLKECYKNASESLVEKLKANWKDSTLQEEDDMYGEKWKRGTTLNILISHQAHHRGQMTVLMRQAGLKVPGFYGPSYEEWQAMGMEPMK